MTSITEAVAPVMGSTVGDALRKRSVEPAASRDEMTDTASSKRPKTSQESSTDSGSDEASKVGATELASAFALASLASLSSSKGATTVHDEHSVDNDDESRAPEDEPVPISPEARSPIRPKDSSGNPSFSSPTSNTEVVISPHSESSQSLKRVHFDPEAIKDAPTRMGSRQLSFPPRLSPHGRGVMPYSRMPARFARPMQTMMQPPPDRITDSPRGAPWQMRQTVFRRNTGGPTISPSNSASSATLSPQGSMTDQWVCDVCNVASFPTYEQACAHEETCRHRQNYCAPAMQGHHQFDRPQQQQYARTGHHWNGPPPSSAHRIHHFNGPSSRMASGPYHMQGNGTGGPQQQYMMSHGPAPPHHLLNRGASVPPPHLQHHVSRRMGAYPAAAAAMGPRHRARPYGSPPIALLNQPVALSLAVSESDADWLSPLNCYIRQHCVQAFAATAEDAKQHSGVAIHQMGIRCAFCCGIAKNDSKTEGEVTESKKEEGSEEQKNDDCVEQQEALAESLAAAVSFPMSLDGIYDAAKRWERLHLPYCSKVPAQTREKLTQMQNEHAWIPSTRQYWADSAKMVGLIETHEGIRFVQDPRRVMPHNGAPLPSIRPQRHRETAQSSDAHTNIKSGSKQSDMVQNDGEYLVYPHDTTMVPPYVYFLMRQVESCHFTEADRFVARSKGPVGYPGFQCRHCHGHAGLGKYFPVTSKSLATNSTSQNIHAHLLKCRRCPAHCKEQLVALKEEKSKAPRLEPGWRKVFFDKIWERLHHPGNQRVTTNEEEVEQQPQTGAVSSSAGVVPEVKTEVTTVQDV